MPINGVISGINGISVIGIGNSTLATSNGSALKITTEVGNKLGETLWLE